MTANSPKMSQVDSTESKTPFTSRVVSLDIARGVVMILMAIDHVRVYSGLPAGGPTPGIFFTRWVTHFCAPAFVFLAGTGAFLYGKKINSKKSLSWYLLTRGLFLVVLELTLIRFTWTFNFHYSDFALAGVIWMLGWCMVMMAVLIWLPTWVVGTIGMLMIILQQIFLVIGAGLPGGLRTYYSFLYTSGTEGPSWISILYVLIPWIGVMAVGYAFGTIMTREPAQRSRRCITIGLIATALFLILGPIALHFSPPPRNPVPWLFQLLNQQKYPPSQLFLLMTLGPMILFIGLVDSARGAVARAISTIGKVPLFYYLMHIPLIHVSAILVDRFFLGEFQSQWYATAPYAQVPREHAWALWLLYVVWAIDVAILYAACRWYAGVKAHHPNSLLRYL
jgi:uncharacterized membrane protein